MWKEAAESGEILSMIALGDDCAARGETGRALIWYRKAREAAARMPDIEYTPQVCLRMAQTETRYTSRKKALALAAEARQGFAHHGPGTGAGRGPVAGRGGPAHPGADR